MFSEDLAQGAQVKASETMDDTHDVSQVLNSDEEWKQGAYWCPCEGTEQAWIELILPEERTFDRVMLMEHIQSGQRIERFTLEVCGEDGRWQDIYAGTVVGYKRICCFPKVTTRRVRLNIQESRWFPTLSKISLFYSEREGV